MDIFAEKTILTVTRLTSLLRGVLEENFEHVWVQGEVSNLSFPSSGHAYFTLKDSGAQLRCVMFKGSVKNLKFRPADGMALIVRGRISVYDQRGEYQLICEYMEPAGVGALQMAFVQLKQKLALEGLFDDDHKRPLPTFPRRIGVVTSATGAAIHDILNVLKRRFASLEILIYPVRVQGEGAALEIARAIEEMNNIALADVLIVGRGGGSLEDLWAFNEEVVARAVYRSRLPVISAVGHETDWTICDFVADLRAPTPSAAAELVSSSAIELREKVEALDNRLRRAIESRLTTLYVRVDGLRRLLHDPGTMLGHLSQRVDDLSERLERALENCVQRRRIQYERLQTGLTIQSPMGSIERYQQQLFSHSAQLEQHMKDRIYLSKRTFGELTARLDVLSPLRTLSRGYAIVTSQKGSVVTSATQMNTGDHINLTLLQGSAVCRVEELESA